MEHELKVVGVKSYSEEVFELSLERGGIEFTPGDCLALFDQKGRESRPYSIASGQGDDHLRFVIRHMEDGRVSPYLHSRNPGDVIHASRPFGWFRPGAKKDSPSVLLATGTGISPFLAAVRSYEEFHPAVCLYGVRTLKDAVELEVLSKAGQVLLAVSREEAEGVHHGRISDFYSEMPISDNHQYYLCGLDSMIDEASSFLEEKGIPLAHIHRECFFNA